MSSAPNPAPPSAPSPGDFHLPGFWTDLPWRQVRPVFLPAALIVALAVLAQRIVTARPLLALLDDVHWTVAYSAAAACAWIGAAAASDENRGTRRMMAWGLTSYAFGQVLWDVQVAIGWNPFPAPSDAFYLLAGPCFAVALVQLARTRVQGAGAHAVALDAGALVVASLALTLAFYLPRASGHNAFELAVFVAYPVGLLSAAGLLAVLVPTLRLRLAAGWLLTLLGLLGNGALWLEWNAKTLQHQLGDGTLYNACFSLVALVAGLGAAGWSTRPVRRHAWVRRYDNALRIAPLLGVTAACVAVIAAFSLPGSSDAVDACIMWAAVTVIVLALLRQNILLRERDRLLAAEVHFATLFASASDAILIMNEERFIACNPSAERLFAASAGQICRSTPIDFSPERQPDGRLSAEAAREQLAAALAGGAPCFAWRHLRTDGSDIDCEVALTRVELPGGRAIQAVVRDQSERQQAEAMRRKLEDQLQQASRLEAVGRLAGGVAHDFNNILTVILGTTELALLRSHADEQLQKDLGEVRRSAQRAAGLTAQLLAFSRRQVVAPVPSDLDALVGAALVMLRRLIGEDVDLVYTPGTTGGTVLVDPTQIEQVLVNLAVNARDAMPGGGKVQIATAAVTLDEAACRELPEARPGRYVMLEVRDDGPGIPDDVREHVFEPFFTTKEFGRGTGLGLSTVYGIVKQGGGFIQLESPPGQGACFRLHFPATAMPVQAPARAAAAAPQAGREHVLLVEDDPLVRDMTARVLGGLGYRVQVASCAEEALEYAAVQTRQIDLLLTDVIMPGLSGRELYEQLCTRYPQLPVVYMSGYTHNVIAPHGVLETGTHFIQKPFALDALAKLVRDALERRGAAAREERPAA